jgi:hypothetical protein
LAGGSDCCSINAAPISGPRGFDGVKKVDSIKRRVGADTPGLLVACWSDTAASVQDRAAVSRLLARGRCHASNASTS